MILGDPAEREDRARFVSPLLALRPGDDILETFAVIAEPEDIPKALLARYGDIVDRVMFYAPYQSDPERWKEILAGFKQ